jgi:hypothetical protein
MRSDMTEPSHLTRTLQQFADTLRDLRPENVTKEERATMRAVLIELKWLVEQFETENVP